MKYPGYDGKLTQTGIVVRAVPGDVSFGMEVQRTTAAAGGDPDSAAAASVAVWDFSRPVGRLLLDVLPLDNMLRFYRGRAIGDGYAESAWTPWTTGHTPVLVPSEFVGESFPDGVVPDYATFGYAVTADTSSVSYALTFGALCDRIEVYTVENVATGGANPPLAPAYRAGRLYRIDSLTPTQRIATTAGYYRRTRIVSYNAAGIKGQESAVIETHVDTPVLPGPSGAPSNLAVGVETDTTLPLTWSYGDAAAATRVYVDGVVVFTASAAVEAYTIEGLSAGTTYQVDLDHFLNGQASAKAGVESFTTTAPPAGLDPPTTFIPTGVVAPVYMTFRWDMGANAAGAQTVIEESTGGAYTAVVTTDAGVTTASSTAHTSGSYTFKAKHLLSGSTSAYCAEMIAEYGGT
jgi:hypothetical protein